MGPGYWQDSYLWAQDTGRILTCGLRILAGFLPVGSGYWQDSYLYHKVEMYSFIDNVTFRSSREIFAE